MSLIFYDTETTGTETAFDQILQFAAIHTDTELNELDRIVLRCRLLPHVVPAPTAMQVTGVRVAHLRDPSLPSHYEMIRMVREKLLSWSPALFVGWNSMSFDEHLFRQALYKTLHNPYLTNSNGSSRADAMRMAQSCSVFAPGALIYPLNSRGAEIVKLDQIAPINGFRHDRAHDALGDVEATIHMCRLIKDRAPDVWSNFMRFSMKAAVASFVEEEQVFCWNSSIYGRSFSWMVTAIGRNQERDSEWYVYDLAVDPESLRELSTDALVNRVGHSPKPVKKLKSNSAPMLCSAEEAPASCKALAFGMDVLEQRARMLAENEEFRLRLIAAIEEVKFVAQPSPHVEHQIYDRFFDKSDADLMEAFHLRDWPDRVAIVEQFSDERLRLLGRRLIHIEQPDLLNSHLRQSLDLEGAKRLLGLGEQIGWLTLPDALAEMQLLLKNAPSHMHDFMSEHHVHLQEAHGLALSMAGLAQPARQGMN